LNFAIGSLLKSRVQQQAGRRASEALISRSFTHSTLQDSSMSEKWISSSIRGRFEAKRDLTVIVGSRTPEFESISQRERRNGEVPSYGDETVSGSKHGPLMKLPVSANLSLVPGFRRTVLTVLPRPRRLADYDL
jgi:hypothetical protein